ncbi:MAG: GNAT family N-acetyltransferase, partial [Vicinamibacteria bacterium]
MSEPSLPSPAFEFRPARDADRAFLFQVYATSREAELSVVPWTLETKNLFLRQQFEAQDHHYRSHYPGAEFLVIEREGRSVGRLYLHRSPNDLLVMDIALLPAEQRQ